MIEDLYEKYCLLPPLDLDDSDLDVHLEKWQDYVQLSLMDFARIVALVVTHSDLNSLVNSGVDLDYDNLAPVITLLHNTGHLHFTNRINYSVSGLPMPLKIKRALPSIPIYSTPTTCYNQFPCTETSRIKRVVKLVADYPYVSSMQVGLLGDDDLLSIEIASYTPFEVTVVEKDERVIDSINKYKHAKGLNIEIIEGDLSDDLNIDAIFDTFITDPPYTFYGVLWFIFNGLNLLQTKDRVYLIANQMMLGNRVMSSLFRSLGIAGLFPVEITPAFSQYPLPNHYRESLDWKSALVNMGGAPTRRMMSSTSTLFVMQSRFSDAKLLKPFIEQHHDIFTRYVVWSDGEK